MAGGEAKGSGTTPHRGRDKCSRPLFPPSSLTWHELREHRGLLALCTTARAARPKLQAFGSKSPIKVSQKKQRRDENPQNTAPSIPTALESNDSAARLETGFLLKTRINQPRSADKGWVWECRTPKSKSPQPRGGGRVSPGTAGARVSACWGTAPRLSSKLTVGPHSIKTNSHPTRGIRLGTQGPRNPPGDTSPTPARGCDPQTPVKARRCPGDWGPRQVGTDKPPSWASVMSPRRCPGPRRPAVRGHGVQLPLRQGGKSGGERIGRGGGRSCQSSGRRRPRQPGLPPGDPPHSPHRRPPQSGEPRGRCPGAGGGRTDSPVPGAALSLGGTPKTRVGTCPAPLSPRVAGTPGAAPGPVPRYIPMPR